MEKINLGEEVICFDRFTKLPSFEGIITSNENQDFYKVKITRHNKSFEGEIPAKLVGKTNSNSKDKLEEILSQLELLTSDLATTWVNNIQEGKLIEFIVNIGRFGPMKKAGSYNITYLAKNEDGKLVWRLYHYRCLQIIEDSDPSDKALNSLFE
ncbi:MAG TPA: hypothetical protein VIM16_22945 [Mucilaginibacter sp.]|jgi:hypothetical protein